MLKLAHQFLTLPLLPPEKKKKRSGPTNQPTFTASWKHVVSIICFQTPSFWHHSRDVANFKGLFGNGPIGEGRLRCLRMGDFLEVAVGWGTIVHWHWSIVGCDLLRMFRCLWVCFRPNFRVPKMRWPCLASTQNWLPRDESEVCSPPQLF